MKPQHLPKVLREARERAGLSQGELAEIVDCHQTAVSGWESEEKARGSQSFLRTMRLAAALKLRPADFA